MTTPHIDKNKHRRDYKWEFAFEWFPGIGFGIALGNHQPKKKYTTASWQLCIVFLCFSFDVELSYRYKKFKPNTAIK